MTLIKDLGIKTIKNSTRRVGLYECPTCKKHFEVFVNSVKNGNTSGCNSCSKLKLRKDNCISKSKEYHILNNIKQRCFNKKSKSYINYGGRGISVCDEWKNDYISFVNWANKNGYKEGLSIDRIDNDGNYEPSNCRWVNRIIQSRNTRKIHSNNTTGFRGVCFDKSRNNFISSIGLNNKVKNIGRFKTAQEAAIAYDKYVIDNNLEHTTNNIYKGKSYVL